MERRVRGAGWLWGRLDRDKWEEKVVTDLSREPVMPGSKGRTGPGWKDGTHWCIRQSQSWLKSNGNARARKVGIMKSSPPEDQGARQKVGQEKVFPPLA